MQYTVGLISDSHGVFDKAAAEALRHTDLIIHAGDVGHHGRHREVLQLYAEATGVPLLAVAGNVDDKLDAADRQLLPQHRLVQAAGWKLLVHHIVASGPTAKVDAAAAALIRELQPDIVVCGHSHKACCWQADGVCYINPGSAGPARFKLPRTVALLQLPVKIAPAAAAAGAAASDSNQPNDGNGTCRGQQLACHAEPAEAMHVPGVHTSVSGNSRGGRTGKKRASGRRAGKATAAEHKDVRNCSQHGLEGGEAPAQAAQATEVVFGSSSKGSNTADAQLGQLHITFVQLAQKAPPRIGM